jgi:hypothetical protein
MSAQLTCKDIYLNVGDRVRFRHDSLWMLVVRIAKHQFWIDPWEDGQPGEDGPYLADAVEEVRDTQWQVKK